MKNMINYLECLFTKYSESTRLLFLLDRSSLASRRENCCETVGYKELLEEYNKFSGKAEKTFRRVVEGHFRCKGKFHLHRLADRRRKRFLFLPPRNQRHAFLPGQRKLPLSPGKIHTSGTGRQFGLPAKIFPAGVQFQTAMGKNQSLAL